MMSKIIKFILAASCPLICLTDISDQETWRNVISNKRIVEDHDSRRSRKQSQFIYIPSSAYFKNETEVKVRMGQTAYLHCHIGRQLVDETVSWIRRNDYYILTIGPFSRINSKRFRSIDNGKMLRISSTRREDSGTYECQVGRKPKLTKEIKLTIIGNPDQKSRSDVISRHRRNEDHNTEPPTRPSKFVYNPPKSAAYFDNDTEDEVTVQMGQTAYLHCRVKQLADRTVSWVRQKDYHILTVGTFTYTSVDRFRARNNQGSNEDWTLQISLTRPEDSGIFECQVSSEPKISKEIKLNVIAVKTRIIGAPELYIKSGSTVTLQCLITTTSGRPPEHVFWYHNDEVINYDSQKGINISIPADGGNITTFSKLKIINASKKDTGKYTCKPSFIHPTSIVVHVLGRGEKSSAAMQYETQSSTKLHSSIYILFLIIILSNITSWSTLR
ncbi:Uncharacterised protein g6297 [Pycnogonum litorale]